MFEHKQMEPCRALLRHSLSHGTRQNIRSSTNKSSRSTRGGRVCRVGGRNPPFLVRTWRERRQTDGLNSGVKNILIVANSGVWGQNATIKEACTYIIFEQHLRAMLFAQNISKYKYFLKCRRLNNCSDYMVFCWLLFA